MCHLDVQACGQCANDRIRALIDKDIMRQCQQLYWNGQNLCVHQLLRLYLRVAVSRLGTGISARRRYQRG